MRSQRKSLLLDVSFPKYNGLAEISKIGRKKPTPENKHAQTKVKHTGVSSKARGGLLQNDCCQFRLLFDLQCGITQQLHHVIG
jgi:hypothetical protein